MDREVSYTRTKKNPYHSDIALPDDGNEKRHYQNLADSATFKAKPEKT